MLTALIIANIALTIGLMTMVKQVKKISKEIEDVGSNLSHIQKNVIQLWHINTNIIEIVSELHSKVDNNKGLIIRTQQFNEEFVKKIESISSNLAHIQRNTIEIGNSIASSKKEVIKEFGEAHKKALMIPPAIFIKK